MSARAARALAFAGILLAPAPAAAQMTDLTALDREFTRVVANAATAVVRVGPGFSGVCISPDGFVLTDWRIAEFAKQDEDSQKHGVVVAFPDRRSYRAHILRSDEATRSALLGMGGRGFPYARPGDPGSLAVGNLLLTSGNAFGSAQESEPSTTLGVVSMLHRDAQGRTTLVETSAATNPGQDGGPYFDIDGNFVGLARALADGQSLATVTPVDVLRVAYADLPDSRRAFPPPSSVPPARSKARLLGHAFHLAAAKARKGVVSILVERTAPAADAVASSTPAADEKPSETPPAEPAPPSPPTPPAPEEPKGPPPIPLRDGAITGTMVDARGFVVAPLRELGADVTKIEVLTADGRSWRASVLARDAKSNLALLLLDCSATDRFDVLETVPQDALRHGQFLLAVGAPHAQPLQEDPFVTVGILSAKHRLDPYNDALLTDAGVNVKNAGGALVDLHGRLAAIVLQPEYPFGQNAGLGFAMPMDALARALPRLMDGKDMAPGFMGVNLENVDGRAGVRVTALTAGFPAERAGIREGDLLVRLDQTPIADRDALTEYLWLQKAAGDELLVTLEREGETLEIRLVLAPRPA